MSVCPRLQTYYLRELGPQAQMMSKNCKNERMAMIMQYVAIGSMIIMAGICRGPGHEGGNRPH